MTTNMSGVYRSMRYPYTLTAKVAQFPYKFYFNNSWMFKYLIIGTLAGLPIFYKIQKLSFSPENVKKWNEIHKEMFSSPSHH